MPDLPDSGGEGPSPTPTPPPVPPSDRGWRLRAGTVSLPEVHGSVPVPLGAGFWRKMMALAGPGYLGAVGYMDPHNRATHLPGGARFASTLISAIMLYNLMAIVLRPLSARLRLGT